jgi:hypothetical protein
VTRSDIAPVVTGLSFHYTLPEMLSRTAETEDENRAQFLRHLKSDA